MAGLSPNDPELDAQLAKAIDEKASNLEVAALFDDGGRRAVLEKLIVDSERMPVFVRTATGEKVDAAGIAKAMKDLTRPNFVLLAMLGICYCEQAGVSITLYTQGGMDHFWGKRIRECGNPGCFNIEGLRTRNSQMSRCPCRIAWYCNRDCQRKDRATHASICSVVCDLRKKHPNIEQAWATPAAPAPEPAVPAEPAAAEADAAFEAAAARLASVADLLAEMPDGFLNPPAPVPAPAQEPPFPKYDEEERQIGVPPESEAAAQEHAERVKRGPDSMIDMPSAFRPVISLGAAVEAAALPESWRKRLDATSS